MHDTLGNALQEGYADAHLGVVGIAFPVVSILVIVLAYLLIRRIQRWFGRSLKAQQDLARAAADLADRVERIEARLEEQGKAEA